MIKIRIQLFLRVLLLYDRKLQLTYPLFPKKQINKNIVIMSIHSIFDIDYL